MKIDLKGRILIPKDLSTLANWQDNPIEIIIAKINQNTICIFPSDFYDERKKTYQSLKIISKVRLDSKNRFFIKRILEILQLKEYSNYFVYYSKKRIYVEFYK